jgi:hypothetical protein
MRAAHTAETARFRAEAQRILNEAGDSIQPVFYGREILGQAL